jgi:hypothetical protein
MEIKVLDSIMHGALKPWKMDTTNTRRFTELVKAAKAASPKTIAELQSQMTALLADYPQLKKVLSDTAITNDMIQSLSYKTVLPKYTDTITNFYFLVITAETLRVYNSILLKAALLTELVDIQYQINKVLNSIKVLAKQTAAELIERDFTTDPNDQSNHVHYALHCLKHSLIQLNFSVQHSFENSMQHTTSLEDFYVLDLELPLASIQELEYIGQVVPVGKQSEEYTESQETICFGFKDDVEKLKTVVNQLCYQIEFLNEDVANADELIKAFTAKSILPGAVKSQLGCETKHFRYCIDKFMPYFNSLSLANIEKSKIFYSKKDTLITANNLSASGSKNRIEPKEKATIDKIFKHLQ